MHMTLRAELVDVKIKISGSCLIWLVVLTTDKLRIKGALTLSAHEFVHSQEEDETVFA